MNHTLIFQKAYDAFRLISNLVDVFPKKDRHSLGLRLENGTLNLIEHIIAAETTATALRDRELIAVCVQADICTVLTRLALDRKLIHETNYFTLARSFQEIAKMTTGWRKSLSR